MAVLGHDPGSHRISSISSFLIALLIDHWKANKNCFTQRLFNQASAIGCYALSVSEYDLCDLEARVQWLLDGSL